MADLQSLVADTFSAIPNSDVSEPKYSSDVYDASTMPKLYKLVPIAEKRALKLNWPLHSVYSEWLCRPTSLLSFCLGDESPGSVLSHLKELGYATGLMGGPSYSLPEFAPMRVPARCCRI